MRTWLTNVWDGLRSGFWFLPSAIILGAIMLALTLLTVDARLEEVALPGWITSSAPSARTVLSALAGALLTGTSVVFSITMLVLAQTASQFGSRLLRTVADGNVAQLTLGLFLATSVYCLLVLRTVREDGVGPFVPHLSVATAVVLGLGSLCVLIYFLHDTAASIQAQTVARAVYDDLDDAINRLFPAVLGEAEDTDENALDLPDDTVAVTATGTGYLQAIDGETLLGCAVDHDLVVRVVACPGTFVSAGTTLARVRPSGAERDVDDTIHGTIAGCFLLGLRRTPRQDVICAIDELVEVGVRSLSPGINDPFTALTCVDYLGAGLRRLARREPPSPNRRDDDGVIRVVVVPPTFPEVLDAAVVMLTRHALRTPSVVVRTMSMLVGVAEQVERESDRNAVGERARWIERLVTTSTDEQDVLETLGDLRERVEAALDAEPIDDATTENAT